MRSAIKEARNRNTRSLDPTEAGDFASKIYPIQVYDMIHIGLPSATHIRVSIIYEQGVMVRSLRPGHTGAILKILELMFCKPSQTGRIALFSLVIVQIKS